MDTWLRWLRHPALIITVSVASVVWPIKELYQNWTEVRSILAAADEWLLLSSGLAYGLGLISLALAIRMAVADRAAFAASLIGQLTKYAPGSVWQLAPIVSVTGRVRSGLVYATVTLAAAVASLIFAPILVLQVSAALAVLSALMILRFRRIDALGITVGLLLVVVGCLFLSAICVAAAFQLDVWIWGRRLLTAWALSVLAIPVPAGIGVREASLVWLEPDGSIALAVGLGFRVVTTVVDLSVGLAALVLFRKERDKQAETPNTTPPTKWCPT